MNKIILDTSVFIPFLRKGENLREIIRLTRGKILYLSSVVMQELYTGSKEKRFVWEMDKLYFHFKKAGRVLAPNSADWRLAGLSLNKLGNRYGFDSIRRASLVNDTLIAVSCRREGALLLTLNKKDFSLLHEVIDFKYRAFSNPDS